MSMLLSGASDYVSGCIARARADVYIWAVVFRDGVWIAYDEEGYEKKDPLIRVHSYRQFRKFCAVYGISLPSRRDISKLKCAAHYYDRGRGWTKILWRERDASGVPAYYEGVYDPLLRS